MDDLFQDLRYAIRILVKNPSFSLVAVAALALGIGANTAIFQLLDAVTLRTLPVEAPEQLATVQIANLTWYSGRGIGRDFATTYPMWREIQDHQQGFSSIMAWSRASFNLANSGEVRYARGIFVSGAFFKTLGVGPIMGRIFTAADDRPGCAAAGAVISYAFWQQSYGGEISAIGKKLTLEGHPFEIIGVTPGTFYGMEVGRNFDVAIPVCTEPIIDGEQNNLKVRWSFWLSVVGRLKPGWTLDRASAQLSAISPGLFQATVPEVYDAAEVKHFLGFRLGAFPGGAGISDLRRTYESPLWLLLAIAGLVLLIACANLANLLLARASGRQQEIAVRLALGASRRRLMRQLLAESLVLAGAGALAGAWLAQALSRFLVAFLSTQDRPLYLRFAGSWHVLAFTAGAAVLTCVLFGLTPAWRATAVAPVAAMNGTGRGLTASRERSGLRRVLVVSQVALSMVLVFGALLFVRSLRNLAHLDAGFRENGILITNIDLARFNLPAARLQELKRQLRERVAMVPGVDSVAYASVVPVSGNSWNEVVLGELHEGRGSTNMNRVSPGFFRTLGTPLLAGRDFNDLDTATSPKVGIVNQAFARKFLQPGANPIGQRFRLEAAPGHPEPYYEIVGLAANTKYGDLREQDTAIAYVPLSQDDDPGAFDQMVIRSSAPLGALVGGVKSAVAEVNPELSIDFNVFKTMVANSILRERLMATLSGFFGFLAALLASLGLYGVISYTVAGRTNEIGIRMALGAERGDVMRMILGEAAVLLAAGLALGTVMALAAARAAASLLYGLRPNDPVTLLMAAVTLASVAVGASFIPARRATRVDPMVALRYE
ncbi:MAG TPA: ABC transporter permease [Terriglobia bacterium]|nr:ABC transporter permease [Terriglobia bacterium]